MQEITVFTKPATFPPWTKRGVALDYQRIFAIRVPETHHFIGLEGTVLHAEEGMLALPFELGQRFIRFFSQAARGLPINCHHFGRAMLDLEPSNEELVSPKGMPRTTALALGEVGLLGFDYRPTLHTIGCGLDKKGLQVLSKAGEFAIASNEEVLAYYQSHYAQQTVNLCKYMPGPSPGPDIS